MTVGITICKDMWYMPPHRPHETPSKDGEPTPIESPKRRTRYGRRRAAKEAGEQAAKEPATGRKAAEECAHHHSHHRRCTTVERNTPPPSRPHLPQQPSEQRAQPKKRQEVTIGKRVRAWEKQATQGHRDNQTKSTAPTTHSRQKTKLTQVVAGDRKGESRGESLKPDKLQKAVGPTGIHTPLFNRKRSRVCQAEATVDADTRDQLLHCIPATGHEGGSNMTVDNA